MSNPNDRNSSCAFTILGSDGHLEGLQMAAHFVTVACQAMVLKGHSRDAEVQQGVYGHRRGMPQDRLTGLRHTQTLYLIEPRKEAQTYRGPAHLLPTPTNVCERSYCMRLVRFDRSKIHASSIFDRTS